mmetsp:Transcript_28711/g.51536  ORF Transcript_28711/g.51536 Transcript_28711/m.51536 type:complete len:237 (-) Transcript_28711:1555-2265(-)
MVLTTDHVLPCDQVLRLDHGPKEGENCRLGVEQPLDQAAGLSSLLLQGERPKGPDQTGGRLLPGQLGCLHLADGGMGPGVGVGALQRRPMLVAPLGQLLVAVVPQTPHQPPAVQQGRQGEVVQAQVHLVGDAVDEHVHPHHLATELARGVDLVVGEAMEEHLAPVLDHLLALRVRGGDLGRAGDVSGPLRLLIVPLDGRVAGIGGSGDEVPHHCRALGGLHKLVPVRRVVCRSVLS